MYNRKPIPRNKGRYEYYLEGIDDYAKKIAEELATMYSNTDIMDIERQFKLKFGFYMAREMMIASTED